MTSYQIKGTTGDVVDCERPGCPKTNLKKTVILAPLDADGNTTGEVVHYGVDCAARALRTTETRIRNAATAADAERGEQVRAARELVAVYGAADGDKAATAEIFFARNPHVRGKVRASEWVWPRLADARRLLANHIGG